MQQAPGAGREAGEAEQHFGQQDDTALRASGLAALHPPQDAVLARWGRKVEATAPLAEGDRIEWLRPLVVDPKESRRLRYRAQGVRGRTRSKTAPGR